MAFKVLQDNVNKPAKEVRISSITVTLGDLLERAVGATTWTAVTSSSNFFSRKCIALEAATTADATVLAQEVFGDEYVLADATNNSDVAHDGDRMLATNATAVNNTGTDNTSQNVIFIQTGTAGATTDKKIVGRVLVGNGVDPDAS